MMPGITVSGRKLNFEYAGTTWSRKRSLSGSYVFQRKLTTPEFRELKQQGAKALKGM